MISIILCKFCFAIKSNPCGDAKNFVTLTELENMLPYEREIYLALLNEHVKEENKKMREAKLRG